MRRIIHVDMDEFFAAVEVRDNPALLGKPLIIGAMPGERGVVSTCSYEARKYGVRSAMPISQAYKLCPQGIYMYGNFHKYAQASREVAKIWENYTDMLQYVSIDEAFLDVTHSAHLFGGAIEIAKQIKARTLADVGLTCSVGIGYSKTSAKIASEEKKPDGLFEILDVAAWQALVSNRGVRTIYGVGTQTAAKLEHHGIKTVRDIIDFRIRVEQILGKYGHEIVQMAQGIDERRVKGDTPAKSIGKEHTFQKDIGDFNILRDTMVLIAKKLAYKLQSKALYAKTVTLKITYAGMKRNTRHDSGDYTNHPLEIYERAAKLLEKVPHQPARLVGISVSGFSDHMGEQLNLFEVTKSPRPERFLQTVFNLQYKYGLDKIKTARELLAQNNLKGEWY
ncbi:MAG: DNA polymerase IV [Defluviitaleaceae bacterium]|nr:DNA polymerase IV [Defluviitaleaceae bacterium]